MRSPTPAAPVLALPTVIALGLIALGLGCTKDTPQPPGSEPSAKAPVDDVKTAEPAAKDPAMRANELAQRVIVVDGHVDLPYRLHGGRDDKGALTEDPSKRTDKGDFDAVRAKAGGLNAPFMSIYVPAKHEEEGGGKALADSLIDMVEGLASKNPETFVVARSPADVRAAFAAKKIALPMGMENGTPLEKKLDNVKHFYDRGIRYITLAHSKDNHLSDSSYDDRHTHKGLTDFGKQVVGEMNRLGMFIDVSHLSDDAAAQAIALSTAPVIASHSSCRKFTPDWERNISDELIKAIAAKGGVVQINFGSSFVSDESRKSWDAVREKVNAELEAKGLERGTPAGDEHVHAFYAKNKGTYATVEQVADHVQHVIALVGVDHVGIGSDYDGVGDSLPTGLKDVSTYPNLFRVLLERGLSEADVEKIAGANVLRAWEQVEHIAKSDRPVGG
jgi:membrane dipeptidase